MNAEIPEPEARALRLLQRLVTVLTAVMIAGVITIAALLVIRLQRPALPAFPDHLTLPEGVSPRAVTAGRGWSAVVTEDDRILIFGADGALRQEITLDR